MVLATLDSGERRLATKLALCGMQRVPGAEQFYLYDSPGQMFGVEVETSAFGTAQVNASISRKFVEHVIDVSRPDYRPGNAVHDFVQAVLAEAGPDGSLPSECSWQLTIVKEKRLFGKRFEAQSYLVGRGSKLCLETAGPSPSLEEVISFLCMSAERGVA